MFWVFFHVGYLFLVFINGLYFTFKCFLSIIILLRCFFLLVVAAIFYQMPF